MLHILSEYVIRTIHNSHTQLEFASFLVCKLFVTKFSLTVIDNSNRQFDIKLMQQNLGHVTFDALMNYFHCLAR